MKLLTRCCLLWLFFSQLALAEEAFTQARAYFGEGRYQKALDELISQEKELAYLERLKHKGFLAYWQALCLKRLQRHSDAVVKFQTAIAAGFQSPDLEYEHAQSLYALKQYGSAKDNFTRSYRKNFKPAVSLFYLGSILAEEKDYKDAPYLLAQIRKTDDPDKPSVLQPAEALIGDIYLEKAKDNHHSKELVKLIVIPQYERAIEVNPKSPEAREIQAKVRNLQKEYGLYIFEMINGRVTMTPRYSVNANLETGFDTNVLFSPAETTISKAKQGSGFLRADTFGRYHFYPSNQFSIVPELRYNRTHYLNRVPEIYRNDNYLVSIAIRNTFEHRWRQKPASLLFDYEFQNSQRDVNAQERLVFSSSTHLWTIGERFNFFPVGETTIKLRHRQLHSYLETAHSKANGIGLDQFLMFGKDVAFLTANYDQTRVGDEIFDTDVLMLRGDYILSSMKSWFVPSFGLGFQFTDPINDRENRGTEVMFNPMIKLNHTFANKLRWGLRLDYQQNDSKDEANFSYRKTIVATDLNYSF